MRESTSVDGMLPRIITPTDVMSRAFSACLMLFNS